MPDRTTLRWLLEVLGFGFLLVACLLHSWGWDAAGIALLALSIFVEPPASIRAAVVASLLTLAPITKRVDQEIQHTFQFAYPEVKAERCVWATTPCGRSTQVRAWGDLH